MSRRLAIVFHSAHGHTAHVAGQVQRGAARVPGVEADLVPAARFAEAPEGLLAYDGYVLGSPTYLGGVSAPFKAFMDATGRLWRTQALAGRLAAGFTVSSLPSGDKQSTLLSMVVFAMQHGLLWVGQPGVPEQHDGVPEHEAANRLGAWTGLMAQAGHGAPADGFPPGDLEGARRFGAHVATTLRRLELRGAPAGCRSAPAARP